MSSRRAVTGAVPLDLAAGPLFVWDVLTPALRHETAAGRARLATAFFVGLLVFMVGMLVGGRLADSVPPRLLALISAVGCTVGLLGSAAASTVRTLTGTFGVLWEGPLRPGRLERVAGTLSAPAPQPAAHARGRSKRWSALCAVRIRGGAPDGWSSSSRPVT